MIHMYNTSIIDAYDFFIIDFEIQVWWLLGLFCNENLEAKVASLYLEEVVLRLPRCFCSNLDKLSDSFFLIISYAENIMDKLQSQSITQIRVGTFILSTLWTLWSCKSMFWNS